MTLTVRDAAGNSDTDSVTVTVYSPWHGFRVQTQEPIWWIVGVVVAVGIMAVVAVYLVKVPNTPSKGQMKT